MAQWKKHEKKRTIKEITLTKERERQKESREIEKMKKQCAADLLKF